MARYGYDRSSYDVEGIKDRLEKRIKIDPETAKTERNMILEGKVPIQNLLRSKRKMKLAYTDKEFLSGIDELYPGKNYSKIIEEAGKFYSMENADEKAFDELTPELKKTAISAERNAKVLNSLSAGMDSPAKEIWEAFFGAIADAISENAALNAEVKAGAKLDDADDTGLLPPDMSKFLIENSSEENIKKAGVTDSQLKDIKKVLRMLKQ